MRVSLSFPKLVLVNDLNEFKLGLYLVTMLLTCGPNDIEVLYVTLRILVSCVCGIIVSFSIADGPWWHSFL